MTYNCYQVSREETSIILTNISEPVCWKGNWISLVQLENIVNKQYALKNFKTIEFFTVNFLFVYSFHGVCLLNVEYSSIFSYTSDVHSGCLYMQQLIYWAGIPFLPLIVIGADAFSMTYCHVRHMLGGTYREYFVMPSVIIVHTILIKNVIRRGLLSVMWWFWTWVQTWGWGGDTHTHTHTHTHARTRTHRQTHTHHTHIHTHAYTHPHTHTHTRACRHTHTHTQEQSF